MGKPIAYVAGAAAAMFLLAAPAVADEQLGAYLAGTCNTCHHAGDKATAIAPLAGRDAAELIAALQAYGSGTRQDAIMHAVATSLSETETSEVAAYLARQEVTP